MLNQACGSSRLWFSNSLLISWHRGMTTAVGRTPVSGSVSAAGTRRSQWSLAAAKRMSPHARGRSESAAVTSRAAGDATGTRFGLFTIGPGPEWLIGVSLAIWLMRFWMPTEGAYSGEALWHTAIAMIWLGVVSLWVPIWWRPRLVDALVLLLAGGHLATLPFVIATSGQRLPAESLGWEWVGTASWWWLWRSLDRQWPVRSPLLAAVIAVGGTLAVLALWQHYVDLPSQAAEYAPLIQRAITAEQQSGPQSAAAIEAATALAQVGIPSSGAARELFLNRLQSREPFGLFALANSLAAPLLVTAVVLLAWLGRTLLGQKPRGSSATEAAAPAAVSAVHWRPWHFAAGLTLVVLWALLLTKSRTAFVGFAFGAGCVLLQLTSQRVGRRWFWSGLAFAGLLLPLGVAGLVQTGSLDREVLTESTKSLRYRWEYWQATAALIRQSPVWGTGLGNFREAYLREKLPGASEEIADPHQFFLDAWANGGVFAAIAVVGLLIMGAFGTWRAATRHADTSVRTGGPTNSRQAEWYALSPGQLAIIMAGSLFAMFLIQWLAFDLLDDRLWALIPVAASLGALAAWLVSLFGDSGHQSIPAQQSVDSSDIELAAGLAWCGLTIHWSGAGGMQMPALHQLWLLTGPLLLMSSRTMPAEQPSSGSSPEPTRDTPPRPDIAAAPTPSKANHFSRLAGFGVCAVMAITCWNWGVRPVQLAMARMEAGDQSFGRGPGGFRQAEEDYLAATAADPRNPDPWFRLVELRSRMFAADPQTKSQSELFSALLMAWQTSGRSARAAQETAAAWMMLARKERAAGQAQASLAAATNAAAWSTLALRGYPTQVTWWKELAVWLHESPDVAGQSAAATDRSGNRLADPLPIPSAREAAATAVELDRLNRERGHSDRYLPDADRILLEQWAADIPPPATRKTQLPAPHPAP